MPNEKGQLTAAEKHEQARAFALSGSLSKFQQAKQKRRAFEALQPQQKVAPTKAANTLVKRASKPKKVDSTDPKNWPRVERGDWQYVYVAAGKFAGRFAYYDDHELNEAIIYFGAPLLGDGPYGVKLSSLRKPPGRYCQNVMVSL